MNPSSSRARHRCRAVAFRCREHEPLANVGDPPGPGAVLVGAALSPLKAVDDRLDLGEPVLGVLVVVSALSDVAGAGPEVVLEVTNLGVVGRFGDEEDVATRVEIYGLERVVDALNPLTDRVGLALEAGRQPSDLVDRVLLEGSPGTPARSGEVIGGDPGRVAARYSSARCDVVV